MSEKVYIQDDFGNQIPLLDDYGNLSMQVIMLYTEDKLKAEDRKIVDEFAATDEMSRDALEGFALTSNASRTRHVVNELNAGIQKRSGAKAISPLMPKENSNFDFQKLAAAIALLIVVGGATFLLSRVWNQDELADNTQKREQVEEKKKAIPDESEPVSELADSALTEESAQDKTLVDEVAEARKVPTEADNKPFEEPNQAVIKEKKVKTLEEVTPEPQIQKDIELAAVEETDEDELEVADEKNAQEPASETTFDMIAGNGQSALKKTEENAARSAIEGVEQQQSSQKMEPQLSDVMSEAAQESSDTEAESKAARYPGGDIRMYKFIERKKNYPEALKEQGVSGAITVIFDVDTDGRVMNAKIKNSVNGILDEDALRVVRSMPNWDPANENGQPVKSSRSVVIKYGD